MINALKLAAIFLGVPVVLSGVLVFAFTDNKTLQIEHIIIDKRKNDSSKDSIDNTESNERNFKIVHLSDIHLPQCRVDFIQMSKFMQEFQPDMIALTGDVVHNGNTKISECGLQSFLKSIKKVAPIYFVTGNHETVSVQNSDIIKMLEDSGVTILDNKVAIVNKLNCNDIAVKVYGLKDNTKYEKNLFDYSNLSEQKSNQIINTSANILLAHRPELHSSYTQTNELDLVLCGHAHGGQVRIFGRGLFAPGQGVFPKLSGGNYNKGKFKNTNMIVARGMGNSRFPWRINNKPHMVFITLEL